MTRDLAEIRRDGADNAAEVRELRRPVGDAQRNSTDNATELKELTRLLAEEHSNTLKRLQMLVPASFAVLVTAVAAGGSPRLR